MTKNNIDVDKIENKNYILEQQKIEDNKVNESQNEDDNSVQKNENKEEGKNKKKKNILSIFSKQKKDRNDILKEISKKTRKIVGNHELFFNIIMYEFSNMSDEILGEIYNSGKL